MAARAVRIDETSGGDRFRWYAFDGITNHKFVGALGHTTESKIGGLIYMRARYYDPSVGRFISEDPGQNGENWYAYCNGDPVGRIDETGKWDFRCLASPVTAGNYMAWILAPFLLVHVGGNFLDAFMDHVASLENGERVTLRVELIPGLIALDSTCEGPDATLVDFDVWMDTDWMGTGEGPMC